jgi:mRNA interferase YafQ
VLMARMKPDAPEPVPPPPPLIPGLTVKFKQDVKRQRKRRKDLGKLRAVIQTLCARGTLAPHHKDHALGGDWKGWRDCHVEPDWILIYQEDGNKLRLGRTGTHADLFS